jgi:nucleotide-binding universal stress UspA family protein
MRILLAIDDSRYSNAAVRALIAQIQRRGSHVRVLTVIEPISAYISAAMIPHYVPNVPAVEEDRKKQARVLVERTAQHLRKAGFKTSEAVEMGDPKVKIIDHAKGWRANLIVLGSHGWRGLSRFLMGSVSEAVTRHAGCSVQVVRISATRKQVSR